MQLMNVHLAARSLCTRILASLMEAKREPVRAQMPAPSQEAQEAELTEFDSFLADLGSEPPTPNESNDTHLKDATIAELTARLQDLQALGDQLAATEQERLRAVARIEELESSQAVPTSEKLEKQVASLTRARDRESERLKRMRTKYEERKRVAADRWHELLELRRELKALKRAQKS